MDGTDVSFNLIFFFHFLTIKSTYPDDYVRDISQKFRIFMSKKMWDSRTFV